jgi:hypothetical protein
MLKLVNINDEKMKELYDMVCNYLELKDENEIGFFQFRNKLGTKKLTFAKLKELVPDSQEYIQGLITKAYDGTPEVDNILLEVIRNEKKFILVKVYRNYLQSRSLQETDRARYILNFY